MEYAVFLSNEGSSEEFVGVADSLDRARNLATRHEDGEIPSTPAHLWATARASGRNVPGCSAPPEWYDDSLEPFAWNGRYAIHRAPH